MRESIRSAIATDLGADVLDERPIGGGCINEACACKLSDGRTVFVKHNPGCNPRMFATEAAGLCWLAEANALRVPKVLAVGAEYLALEYIEPSRRALDFDEQLGGGLAALHQFGAECFGLKGDNFLATLEQDNSASGDWPLFYAERRLRPLLRRAIDSGQAPTRWNAEFEELFQRLPMLVGDAEPPARLHGDLWSGNVHVDSAGAPTLVDPATYGGHREIDLAMLRLFGSPGPRFLDAYQALEPLCDDFESRVALYQLYPLLAHVNLFGGSYCASTDQALRRYL